MPWPPFANTFAIAIPPLPLHALSYERQVGSRHCTKRSLNPPIISDDGRNDEGAWHTLNADFAPVCGEKPSVHCGNALPATLEVCSQDWGNGQRRTDWLIGPFTSTGGYDWWQVQVRMTDSSLPPQGWSAGASSITLHEVTSRITADESPASALLGTPPLHNHHSSIRQTCHKVQGCEDSPDGQQVALHITAGDEQCPGEVDGFRCLSVDGLAHGYTMPTWSELHGVSLINDVRPNGSRPLTWYVNISLTFVDPSSAAAGRARSLTSLNFYHPTQRGSTFSTLAAPAKEDSFLIWSLAWPTSGAIVVDPTIREGEPGIAGDTPMTSFTSYHTHQNKAQLAFLFAGSLADIGLASPAFRSPSGCDAVTAASAGFASNEAMLAYLLSSCPSCFYRTSPSSKLICKINASVVTIDGVSYERASRMQCNPHNLRFLQNQTATVLAFYGDKPDLRFAGSAMSVTTSPPSTAESAADSTEMHSIWYLKVVPDKGATPASRRTRPGMELSRPPVPSTCPGVMEGVRTQLRASAHADRTWSGVERGSRLPPQGADHHRPSAESCRYCISSTNPWQ